ncbi:unnamed protein product, partial [Gulo gulo]
KGSEPGGPAARGAQGGGDHKATIVSGDRPDQESASSVPEKMRTTTVDCCCSQPGARSPGK